MPRGHKSKGRSRAKRQQTRVKSEDAQCAQPPAEEKAESPTVQVGQGGPFTSAHASNPQGTASLGSPHVGRSCTSSNIDDPGFVVGASGRSSSASQVEVVTQPIRADITRKESMLMEFLLEKFKMKESFTEADMMSVVNMKYKAHFTDILRKTSARMEMVFGMDLKLVCRSSHSYALISKLGLSTDEILSGNKGLPKMGLLMTILGVIFAKGNRATEEEVWEFLNMLGVYAGREHVIFGEPQKLVTNDLVQQNYLEIRKVPDSDPPSYDFLWGSRSFIETNKMKVLEVWAKIHDAFPHSFPHLFEEALRDQRDRAERRSAALGYPVAMARLHRRCMSKK